MHSLVGNGRGSAKGKQTQYTGKGKHNNDESEEMFHMQVRMALRDAAKHRLMPMLLQEEWSGPIRQYHELKASGGIAAIHKEHVPAVLMAVEYTMQPTAILTTQSPQQLGLRGYASTEVQCTFRVFADDGVGKDILVKRYLVQLGFGEVVTRSVVGVQVAVPTTMHRITLKIPKIFGWTEDACSGTTCT